MAQACCPSRRTRRRLEWAFADAVELRRDLGQGIRPIRRSIARELAHRDAVSSGRIQRAGDARSRSRPPEVAETNTSSGFSARRIVRPFPDGYGGGDSGMSAIGGRHLRHAERRHSNEFAATANNSSGGFGTILSFAQPTGQRGPQMMRSYELLARYVMRAMPGPDQTDSKHQPRG